MRLIDLEFKYDKYKEVYIAWHDASPYIFCTRYVWNGVLTAGRIGRNFVWKERILKLPPALYAYMMLRYPV